MGLENKEVLATIQTQPELVLPTPALYGRTEVLATTEATKAVRKAKRKVETLKDRGVINSSVEIGEHALLHSKNGDVYTSLTSEAMHPLFVRAEIAHDVPTPIKGGCIITGSCLFGDLHAQAVTGTGKHISLVNKKHTQNLNGDVVTDIQTVQGLHPYEIDTIARLSRAFALTSRRDEPMPTYVHIPEMEYWMYLFDQYQDGKITLPALQQWCYDVSKHSKRVAQSFGKRIQKSGNVELQHYNPFTSVQETVFEGVMSGSIPQVQELSTMLYETDQAWQPILETQQLETFVDLANATNAVPYIHGMQVHGGVTAIENPEESMILKVAKGLIPEGNGHLYGLYVHPNVFIQDSTHLYGEDEIYDLYYLNGHNNLQTARTIISSYT